MALCQSPSWLKTVGKERDFPFSLCMQCRKLEVWLCVVGDSVSKLVENWGERRGASLFLNASNLQCRNYENRVDLHVHVTTATGSLCKTNCIVIWQSCFNQNYLDMLEIKHT